MKHTCSVSKCVWSSFAWSFLLRVCGTGTTYVEGINDCSCSFVFSCTWGSWNILCNIRLWKRRKTDACRIRKNAENVVYIMWVTVRTFIFLSCCLPLHNALFLDGILPQRLNQVKCVFYFLTAPDSSTDNNKGVLSFRCQVKSQLSQLPERKWKTFTKVNIHHWIHEEEMQYAEIKLEKSLSRL